MSRQSAVVGWFARVFVGVGRLADVERLDAVSEVVHAGDLRGGVALDPQRCRDRRAVVWLYVSDLPVAGRDEHGLSCSTLSGG
ncbi:MAG TPA: hypothetical protein VFZ70_11275 [Euzebyales bacterium]